MEMQNAALIATLQNGAVVVAALYGGVVYLRSAISESSSHEALQRGSELSQQDRIQHADDERERPSAISRYIVAGVCFGTACTLLVRAIPPIVGYAIVCLAYVAQIVQAQIAEERAPRRRSVLLGRSRRVNSVLATWIGLAAVYSLLLIPWVLDDAYRGVAILVGACVVTMLVVAWRIATSPPLLFGNDLEAEQVVDRETRAIRTGKTCFFAIVTVFVFIGFAYGPSIPGAAALLLVPAGLAAWTRIYARRLSRTPLTS
jgi:uncharacterized membrane protein YqjE